MRLPRLAFVISLGLPLLPAHLNGKTAELRQEYEPTYFDAKQFASAVPSNTVVYARIGSRAAFGEALQKVRPLVTADLPEIPKGQIAPRLIKRDILAMFNPRPTGPVQCSVLALVNTDGDVIRVFIADAEPRTFGRRLADTVAKWKYDPAQIDGVAVPAIVYETFSAGSITYVSIPGITFDQSDKADFAALKKSIDPLYDAKQFATFLPAQVVVWPADLTASPVFQLGLQQLRQHTQTRFVAYPAIGSPIFIDRQDEATYPVKHKRKGKEGEAHVFLLINSTGRIVKFYVAEATDEIFAAAAIHALTNWVFTPAEIEGSRIPFLTMQTVKFTFKK